MMADTGGAVPHQQHDGTNAAAARLGATEETIDVEEVKRTEAKLQQDEQELQRIIDLIPQTIIVLNPDLRTIYANRVALEDTGLSLDEVRADNFRDRVFHPEDIQTKSWDARQRRAPRLTRAGGTPALWLLE